MAGGRERHHARVEAVNALGRDLNRRARSKCELCGENTSLKVLEVPPAPEEPHVDAAVMVCEACTALVEGSKDRRSTDELRFLAEAIWSEIPPVQVVAVRSTRGLAARGVPWAQQAVESLWLDEDMEARVAAS